MSDNFDPLRKVYPFLDPAKYEPWVGKPLSEIPCPCGDHTSYAEHFLAPFLDSGRMTPQIVTALERRGRIVEILHELTGKEMDETWSPFTPLCPSCGKIAGTRVLGFSSPDETIDIACACGVSQTVPMAGGGKLIWRIDWPARWKTLGVTLEPFGKDHSTRGGSYDTGVRIAREVFDVEPPHPVPYEWIRLKGKGDMSSSKGNVLSIGAMLDVVPPEVLRYLVIRERPPKTIGFDPGLPLLQLVDHVDGAVEGASTDRALELSRAGGFEPVGVPYRHLVVVAQAARFDLERILAVLHRTGYPDVSRGAVASRMEYARTWLERFAPEDVRFEVQETLPPEAASLDASSRAFLRSLAEVLETAGPLDDTSLHDRIYELAGTVDGTAPKELFRAIYVSLLGKPRGPRAAAFINVLGTTFCAARFREAAANEGGEP